MAGNTSKIRTIYLGGRVHATITKFGTVVLKAHNGRAVTDTVLLSKPAVKQLPQQYEGIHESLRRGNG